MKKNLYLLFILFFYHVQFLCAQWTTLNSGAINFLTTISFPSNSTGYINQENGYLRKSIDGGQSWSLINSNVLVREAQFSANDTGWAFDDYNIYKTVDGGLNWITQYSDSTNYFFSLFVLDGNNVYLSAGEDSSSVLRTNDGGITWQKITFWNYQSWLYKINMVTPQVGYILDDGMQIFKTIDSGATWNIVYTFSSATINNIIFLSPDTGFVVGLDIYKTIDGGISWNLVNTNGLTTAWYDLGFINDSTGFVVGGDGFSQGTILKTTNKGLDWNLDVSTAQTFNDLYFTKDNIGFTCGTGGVLMKYNPPVLCSAHYSLYADTIAHTYIALNNSMGTSPTTYLWSWGDGNYSGGATPSHTYSTEGTYTICLAITDFTGCNSFFCDSSYLSRSTSQNSMVTVNVIASTGINESSKNENVLNVFPNPATDNFRLVFSGKHDMPLTCEILNVFGQTMYETPLKFSSYNQEEIQAMIDISFFVNGVYMIRVGDGLSYKTRKLIIE